MMRFQTAPTVVGVTGRVEMKIKKTVKLTNPPITGVILAGGHSRRMGQNKALMPLGTDTVIGHVIRQVLAVTSDLLLITNTPETYTHLNLPMHPDLVPNRGALGGIYTGLTYATNSIVLCVACDMPLLRPILLSHLSSYLGKHDAVVPYVQALNCPTRTFQTLCAAYSKRCLPIIDQMFAEGELRVHALYERISVRVVAPTEWRQFDPQGVSFFNINTPADFEEAERMLKSFEIRGEIGGKSLC